MKYAPGTVDWFRTLEVRTLPELIRRRAAQYPQKTLVIIEDESLTYGQLEHRSNALAAGLLARGLKTGDRVASFRYNCVDDIVLWFACAKAGMVWVPINVSLLRDDLAYVLDDVSPVAVAVDSETLGTYLEVRSRVGVPDIEIVSGQASAPAGFLRLASLMAEAAAPPAFAVGPGSPATVTYTGGSSGLPKGVVIPHFAYIAAGLRYQEVTEATSADVMVALGHLFHVGGQQIGLIGPMFCGMTTVLSKWFSASRYWTAVREHGATIIDPFGSVVVPLLRQPARDDDGVHLVRTTVGTGTAQLPPGSREAFESRFKVRFTEVYAQTEVGCLVVSWRADDARPGSCGRSHGWAEIGVVDEDDNLLPPGEQGQIVLRPNVPHTFMVGYLNKPDQTRSSWANLWHHTGDHGWLDEDGYLYFTGRAAHWMRVRGENVSCLEVESVIAGLASVAEVAVVGIPGALGDDDIKAYVVLDSHARNFRPQSVVDVCRERLAYFKVPRYVEIIADLPKSVAKQEVMRHVLRDRGVAAAWDAVGEGYAGRRGRRG